MPSNEIDINQLNAKGKLAGIKRCEEAGIDYTKYRQLFPLMAENDVPLINRLPDLEQINELWWLKDSLDDWNSLKKLYGQIDLNKQTDESGKDIIIATKELLAKFDELFQAHVRNAEKSPTLPPPPPELIDLQKQMLTQAQRYAQEVPAYLAYREVGVYELDPEGRRGYQQKETAHNQEQLLALKQRLESISPTADPGLTLPRR